MFGSRESNKVSFWIKCLIFVVVAIILVYILNNNEKLNDYYLQSLLVGWERNSLFLLVALLLVPVNWSLEAHKWKFLIRNIERISFIHALESVLIGVSMGFVTPHSLGDYVARIFTLTIPERAKAIGAVFLCRISQFYITLWFGSASLVVYLFMVLQQSDTTFFVFVLFTIFNNIVFITIFIFHKRILRLLLTYEPTKKLFFYFEVIGAYTFKEVNFVLFLSLIRYCVFCFQFMLILSFFDIEIVWWLMLSGVAFVFFVKSIVPTFFDLGIRELAAVGFLGVFYYDHQIIIFASLTLWLINLVIPSIIGLFLLYKMKLFNKEKV